MAKDTGKEGKKLILVWSIGTDETGRCEQFVDLPGGV